MINKLKSMVQEKIVSQGIKDTKLINAMLKVDRSNFVPSKLKYKAYEDRALPIGEGQTISQPYMVAYMINLVEINNQSKVLEVGTGSGYGSVAKITKKLEKTVDALHQRSRLRHLPTIFKSQKDHSGLKTMSHA